MGKNKLRKFAEMEQMQCVYQYPFAVLESEGGCPMRGRWGADCFGNDNPLTLELGCGKGEYTVELARRNSGGNFIGIDIKGARMWTGAREATSARLDNVAFLRTSIELLDRFFEPGEVSDIWITFPDPQMKKARKRLTGTKMLETYRRVLRPDGVAHLKTDSPFLYRYTLEMLQANDIQPLAACNDIYAYAGLARKYGQPMPAEFPPALTEVRTYYEQQWLSRGMTIKYIAFRIPEGELREPDVEIEPDNYRAYPRHTVMPSDSDKKEN